MIIGQAQRKHGARLPLAVGVFRFYLRPRNPENRDLGRIDDRRKGRTADAAQIAHSERSALHLFDRRALISRAFRDRRDFER